MSGLREAFDEIVADVPVYGDLDQAIEQADRERRRRSLIGAAAASAAAVVVATAIAAGVADRRGAEPVLPGPSPAPTETTAPANPMVNGRIQSTDEYLGRSGAACDGCYWPASTFDQRTGTLLVVDSEPEDGPAITGIRAIGPDGQVAGLACPDDFACPQSYVVALGPGPEEFSDMAHDHQLQVVGFDGKVRRVIDLSAALGEDESAYVSAVTWSPDGSRLAVQTQGSGHERIWLFDRDGGDPPLLYSASTTEEFPRLAITGLAWSPDGSRLGFVEEHWNMAAEFGRPESEISETTKALTLSVPDAEEGVPGAARTLYEYTKDRHPQYEDDAPSAFLWSPDGARVAVRVYDQMLELSAEDGTLLAEHRFIEGLLIWPARRP